jgi:hypothetical protein
VVEHLHSKHEALSSKPTTDKKKDKRARETEKKIGLRVAGVFKRYS